MEIIKIMQLHVVSGCSIIFLFQDIITNNRFYKVNRGVLCDIVFPLTGSTGTQILHAKKPKLITNIATVLYIPCQTDCQTMLQCFEKMKQINAISCSLGIFDKPGVEMLLKIHELKEIAGRVKSEKKWLEKTVPPPHKNCSLPDGISQFTDLIFTNNDGKVVINKSLLASDLATLTSDSWLTLSLIQGYVDLLNSSKTNTKTFILNNLMGWKKKT